MNLKCTKTLGKCKNISIIFSTAGLNSIKTRRKPYLVRLHVSYFQALLLIQKGQWKLYHNCSTSFSNTTAGLRTEAAHCHLKVLQIEFYEYLLLLAVLAACKRESFGIWKAFAIIFWRNKSKQLKCSKLTKTLTSIYFCITSSYFFWMGTLNSQYKNTNQMSIREETSAVPPSILKKNPDRWKNINFTLKSQLSFQLSFVSGMCDRKWKKNCAISADAPCN